MTNERMFNQICDWIEQDEKEQQHKKLYEENQKLKKCLAELFSFCKEINHN